MIIDEDEAGLTIVAKIVLLARKILGALTDKSKIHGETLIHLGSTASGRGAPVAVTHLGSQADWALFENGSLILELRHTSGIAVSIDKLVVRAMGEALMPKETSCCTGELTNSKRGNRRSYQGHIRMTR